MADAAHLLDGLHPLHIASGMDNATPVVAMASLGCAAALVCAFTLGPWLIRRRALRRFALEALAATRTLPEEARLVAQATLLRRVSSQLDAAAAKEHGDVWLTRLDRVFSTQFFSRQGGQAFGDALYRPPGDFDVDALDEALRRHFSRISR
jgi:hypothetical protein